MHIPTILPIALAVAAPLVSAACGVPEAEARADQAAPTPAPCRIAEKGRDHIDGWLERNGLDSYGSPPGSTYLGGTPLFDEATGQVWNRHEFVLARHPELTDGLSPLISWRDRLWLDMQRVALGLDATGRAGAVDDSEPSPLVDAEGRLIDRALHLIREHPGWYAPDAGANRRAMAEAALRLAPRLFVVALGHRSREAH